MKFFNKDFLGIKISALIEMTVLLFLISLSGYFFGDNHRYINIYPHPFWIVLLIIVIQYNTAETLICVVMMTLFLYVGNKSFRISYETNHEYYFLILARPILWFVVAILLDLIRSKRFKKQEVLETEILNNKDIADKLAKSYKEIQKNNYELEAKLAGEVNTILKTFRATLLLGDITVTGINQRMARFVDAIIKPEKFSFYMLDQNGLSLIFEQNWEKSDNYPREYLNTSSIYKKVIIEKKFLSIGNEKDEKYLKLDGVFAGPIINPNTKEVFGLLKFEEFSFTGLVSKNFTMFKIICEWIGFAFSNYKEMRTARRNTLSTFNDNVYSKKFLKIQTEILLSLSKRFEFDICRITVYISNFSKLDINQQNESREILSEVVKTHTRNTDMIFELKGDFSSFVILLPGTNIQNTEMVLNKIKAQLLNKQDKTNQQVKYSFIITPLR